MEHNRVVNMSSNVHMPGASANVDQTHVALNNDQSGRNHDSSLAYNFIPNTAPPMVSTSVAQNYNSNDRSRVLNSNLQQPTIKQ